MITLEDTIEAFENCDFLYESCCSSCPYLVYGERECVKHLHEDVVKYLKLLLM